MSKRALLMCGSIYHTIERSLSTFVSTVWTRGLFGSEEARAAVDLHLIWALGRCDPHGAGCTGSDEKDPDGCPARHGYMYTKLA